MSGIAQIIQALMSVSPQVTQMGAAPTMGGGGGFPSAMGAGGGIGLNFQRQQQQPYEMQQPPVQMTPQVQGDPMQQPQPPGYPGSPMQGPPDPAQAYQPGQEPRDPVAALERAWYENEEKIRSLTTDNSIGGRWKQKEELPGLLQTQQALAQQMRQYEAEQQAMAMAERGRMAFEIANRMKLPNAQEVADLASQNETIMENLLTAHSAWEEQNRERRWAQSDQTQDQYERQVGIMEFGVPEESAYWFSLDDELGVKDAVELYFKRQQADDVDTQMKFEAMQARDNAIFSVDNTIKQITNTLDSARGFGALGLMGALTDIVPESPAYNTVSGLDTQRAALAFRELRDMREASKTGGALGNVSNREIELLYSAWTRLDPRMGDQFLSNLADVMQRYERLKWMLQNEEKSLERMKAGELTPQQFFNEATEYTNKATARHMGTPMEALEDLKNNPETLSDFITTFGWSPISNVRQ